jgi:hypothetical protein
MASLFQSPCSKRELQYLPASSAEQISKAFERLLDGDENGAVTSACGAVDTATLAVYAKYGLGQPPDSFQTKVNSVMKTLNIYGEMAQDLKEIGVPAGSAEYDPSLTSRRPGAAGQARSRWRFRLIQTKAGGGGEEAEGLNLAGLMVELRSWREHLDRSSCQPLPAPPLPRIRLATEALSEMSGVLVKD